MIGIKTWGVGVIDTFHPFISIYLVCSLVHKDVSIASAVSCLTRCIKY